MSLRRALPVLGVLASTTAAAWAAPALLPPAQVVPPTNPQAYVFQWIGATEVEVAYSRPGVKARTIFGGLVPYGSVWRTGADQATRIRFSTPVRFEGAEVDSGTYELFTVPGPSEWTVILQSRRNQWGSYAYDSVNDVARVRVAPERLPAPVESFAIAFGDLTANAATMALDWEQTRVPVRIETDVVAQVVPRIEAAMQGEESKPYFHAAMFYFENGLDLDRAAEWIAAALAANPGHIGMLHRQALILEKKGDLEGAREAARKSLEGAASAPPALRDEYVRLNTALLERMARAEGK